MAKPKFDLDNLADKRAAGQILEAALAGMSRANMVDPSGHSALTARVVEVPRPDAPAPAAPPTPRRSVLDPKLGELIDERAQKAIEAAIGPVVEAAVRDALAKFDGDDGQEGDDGR